MIVNNGVFVYDPLQQKNILANYIPNDIAAIVAVEFQRYGIHPQIFTFDQNDGYRVHYRGIFHPGEDFYLSDRLAKGDQRFIQTDNFSDCLTRQVITFIAINDREKLEPLFERLKDHPGLVCYFGENIYSKAYWLELTSKNATVS